MIKCKEQNNTKTKGSFLIELLLSFAIISISMTVIVDSFMSSQRTSQITSEEVNLIKAISMVFEDMTREARVSTDYSCAVGMPSPCTGNEFFITYIEGLNGHNSEVLSYQLTGGRLQKEVDGGGYLDMTPPGIVVDTFNVRMVGELPDSPVRALVTLSAHSSNAPSVQINMQTSFTERVY